MYLYTILISNRDHTQITDVYPHTAVHNSLLTVTLEIVLPCASTGKSYKPVFSSVQLNVHHVAESFTVEPLVL